MSTGTAILIVGGAVLWLWGMATPGLSIATLGACALGGAMLAYGVASAV